MRMLDNVLCGLLLAVAAIACGIALAATPAAEPGAIYFQCGEYGMDGVATFHNCGPPVAFKKSAAALLTVDANGVVHTPHSVPTPAASDHQPPRFLPAVILYDKDNRFIAIEVGKTFSFSCKAALDDAQATIEKATAAGRRLVGLCVPVPTYSAADLIPEADGPKARPDNAV